MLHDVSLNLARVILHIKNEYDIVLNKTLVESIIDDAKQLIIKIREQGITSFGG
jgi:acyl carrier protein